MHTRVPARSVAPACLCASVWAVPRRAPLSMGFSLHTANLISVCSRGVLLPCQVQQWVLCRQLRRERQQSPGCLAASGRPRTELLRRYCASYLDDMRSRASPEPAGPGRAKNACLWTGPQAERFCRERPRMRARGTSTPLSGGGPPARCFPAGEGAGGLGLVLVVSPGWLTRRPGPASGPGSRRISAPRRPELVLSCEQILLLPRGSLQTEDRLAKELGASAIRKPQATTHLVSVGDEGERLQKAFTAGLLCGRGKNRDFLIPLLPNTVMCFSLHRCWLPPRDSFALRGAEPTPIRTGLAPGRPGETPLWEAAAWRLWRTVVSEAKTSPASNRTHSALLWRRLLVTPLVPNLALPQRSDRRNATDKPKRNTHNSSQRRFSTNTRNATDKPRENTGDSAGHRNRGPSRFTLS